MNITKRKSRFIIWNFIKKLIKKIQIWRKLKNNTITKFTLKNISITLSHNPWKNRQIFSIRMRKIRRQTTNFKNTKCRKEFESRTRKNPAKSLRRFRRREWRASRSKVGETLVGAWWRGATPHFGHHCTRIQSWSKDALLRLRIVFIFFLFRMYIPGFAKILMYFFNIKY